jgi:valyl-tRNA synthetase
VKAALAEKGLDRGSKPHSIPYARCQRTQDILEPLLLPQWYVRWSRSPKPALEAVEEGRTTFTPEEWRRPSCTG